MVARWKSDSLRKALAAEAEAVKRSTDRQHLPLSADLFSHATDSGLANLNELLGIETDKPDLYWAMIFAEVNVHLIENRKITSGKKVVAYVRRNLTDDVASHFLLLFSYFRLEEAATLVRNASKQQEKVRSKGRLKVAKTKARYLCRFLPKVMKQIKELHEELEDFEGQTGFESVEQMRGAEFVATLYNIKKLRTLCRTCPSNRDRSWTGN